MNAMRLSWEFEQSSIDPILHLYDSSVQTMNRQFSQLMASLILLTTFCIAGCDLGTYNKRFQERNNPVEETPAEDSEDDSNDVGDSDDA